LQKHGSQNTASAFLMINPNRIPNMSDEQAKQELARIAQEFEHQHTAITYQRLFQIMVPQQKDWHPSN
jgi:hypothetical protein